jgi:cell division protein FtsB
MDSKFFRKDSARGGFKSTLLALARSKRFMVRFVAGVIVGAVVFFGDHGIVQRIRLSYQKSDLQTKIAEAERESKRLQAQSRALDGDAKAIEKVAREKHGMIREGETVYKVNKK